MPRFVITDPSGQNEIFEIVSSAVTIGRADSCDLILKHPSVSRQHARLTVLPGDISLLIDLGSLNGTLVNGEQIREHRLVDRDRINVGMYELRYELAAPQDLHIEAGASPDLTMTGLVDLENLATAMRPKASPPPPSPQGVQERVRTLEQENSLLRLLLTVSKTLASALGPGEIMQNVMKCVFEMENVERGFVMLRDEKKGFHPAVIRYKDESLKAGARDVALSKTLIDRVLAEGLPLLIYDVSSDQRFAASLSMRMSGIRSAMCAPLVYKEKVFGLFYVDCLTKPYAFSKAELDMFAVIAAEAAISFDNAFSHEELSRRMVERQALERFLSGAIVERILANPDQVHLGGENQSVTILFADIRGFTRMSEHMEPQAVVELLNEYFSEMTDLVFENGGTLDKYLGDGLMVLFGAPLAKPDDARRAVKTATEMQRALQGLNRQWEGRGQQALHIGIGINTGPVTAGNIGSARRMDYTVIGDAVNLASRLCANAAGGQILISESTFRQLDDQSPARHLEPIRVKGKETPVEVYEMPWKDPAAKQAGDTVPP